MVDVMEALAEIAPQINFRLIIIGEALTSEDRIYQQQIYARLGKSSVARQISFVGHVPMANIPNYYNTSFLHLNLSLTGIMDKTVMEALAAGCPVLTSNEAFYNILHDFPQYIIKNNDIKAIAQQILSIYNDRNNVNRNTLRELIINKHDLATYPQRILEELRKIQNESSNY
jgi:glycosyltransferase involved in cell wall biosynthesis